MAKTITVTYEEKRAAARTLFESTPEAKFLDIAEKLSVSEKEVRAWFAEAKAAGAPWRMFHVWEAAGASGGRKHRDLVQDLNDTREEAESEARAVVDATPLTLVPGPHAELLKRHREEWVGPRALSYQAMKMAKEKGRLDEAFTLAKLAKISAETLTLIQVGERRSHGVKDGDGDGMVVIERTGGGK